MDVSPSRLPGGLWRGIPACAALELFWGALLPARVWRARGSNEIRIPAPSCLSFSAAVAFPCDRLKRCTVVFFLSYDLAFCYKIPICIK